MNYIAELLKNERSTYTPSQKGQKGQKPQSEPTEEKNIAAPYAPSQKGQKGQKVTPNESETVHRWRDESAPGVATPAATGSAAATAPAMDATSAAAATGSAAAATATALHTRDSDNRARALLAKYRREGGVIELEEIEAGGATWLSLACDLSAMPDTKREGRYLAIEQNARLFQRALELERRANPTQSTD